MLTLDRKRHFGVVSPPWSGDGGEFDRAAHFSQDGKWFTNGGKLLAAAERMGIEGVVSKIWVNGYRSGPRCDRIKVKCPSWRERNRDRWRLFERR
jgi:ATP-dependent DNA ligase